MPGCLDVIGNPIVNCFIVLLRILDILMDFASIVRLGRPVQIAQSFACEGDNTNEPVPSAHVDTDSETVGHHLLSSLDVDILAGGR